MRKLSTIELGTKRLLLRRFVVEDAKAMFENWASDTDNLKYVTWDPHTNPQVTQASIERWLLITKRKTPTNGRFARKMIPHK